MSRAGRQYKRTRWWYETTDYTNRSEWMKGYKRRMRSAISKENPERIWWWDEKQPGTKGRAHRWERRVGKKRVIQEQLQEEE